MRVRRKLTSTYFNLVYNPVYDFIVARLVAYHRLQSICLNRFQFNDGDRVLCVGVGTGNEIIHIHRMNRQVDITGVDCSVTALKRAYRKALNWGKKINIGAMDAQNLDFASGDFDKVLCLHVMDFIEDKRQATAEILRVLKSGGQFVITYPSQREGTKLGINLLTDSLRHSLQSGKYLATLSGLLTTLAGGLVYCPLLLRPGQRIHSRAELATMFLELGNQDYQIEDYPIYYDLIVYGRK